VAERSQCAGSCAGEAVLTEASAQADAETVVPVQFVGSSRCVAHSKVGSRLTLKRFASLGVFEAGLCKMPQPD